MAGPRATFTSRADVVQRAMHDALAAGLAAAGNQYADRVGRRLAFGYTSGDFVTGNVAGSVEVTPVERIPGGLEVKVGSNVDYALFWELGHVNLFTARHTATAEAFFAEGGYQRVEIWRPFLVEMRQQLGETIRSTAVGIIEALAGRGRSPVDVVTGETRDQKRQRIRNLVDR